MITADQLPRTEGRNVPVPLIFHVKYPRHRNPTAEARILSGDEGLGVGSEILRPLPAGGNSNCNPTG